MIIPFISNSKESVRTSFNYAFLKQKDLFSTQWGLVLGEMDFIHGINKGKDNPNISAKVKSNYLRSWTLTKLIFYLSQFVF